MGWLIGNMVLLSLVGVVCLVWWGYGALMWALGWPPNDHPVINTLAAILSLLCGYFYITRLLAFVRKRDYRRTLNR